MDQLVFSNIRRLHDEGTLVLDDEENGTLKVTTRTDGYYDVQIGTDFHATCGCDCVAGLIAKWYASLAELMEA